MTLVRWDPIDELAELRESMHMLLTDFPRRRPRAMKPVTCTPAVEVLAEQNEVPVKVQVTESRPV
ncbi:MAG: hypothetical protein WD140_06105 [bacterium]